MQNQTLSIQKRVREAAGITITKPVYYSIEYEWNIQVAFDFIIDSMPTQRRMLVK